MGTIKHHTIVIVGNDDKINIAHEAAKDIFNKYTSDRFVSNITGGYGGTLSFFIAPDGSKEGWDNSNLSDLARDEFIEYLRSEGLDFVEVTFGGDTDDAMITAKNY